MDIDEDIKILFATVIQQCSGSTFQFGLPSTTTSIPFKSLPPGAPHHDRTLHTL